MSIKISLYCCTFSVANTKALLVCFSCNCLENPGGVEICERIPRKTRKFCIIKNITFLINI